MNSNNLSDLINLLYKKYEEPIIFYAREHLGNIQAARERIAIKFQYANPSGSMVTVEPFDEILSIMNLSDTIYWTVETFG